MTHPHLCILLHFGHSSDGFTTDILILILTNASDSQRMKICPNPSACLCWLFSCHHIGYRDVVVGHEQLKSTMQGVRTTYEWCIDGTDIFDCEQVGERRMDGIKDDGVSWSSREEILTQQVVILNDEKGFIRVLYRGAVELCRFRVNVRVDPTILPHHNVPPKVSQHCARRFGNTPDHLWKMWKLGPILTE